MEEEEEEEEEEEVKCAGTFTKNRILLLLMYTGNKPGTSDVPVWEGKLKKKTQFSITKIVFTHFIVKKMCLWKP